MSVNGSPPEEDEEHQHLYLVPPPGITPVCPECSGVVEAITICTANEKGEVGVEPCEHVALLTDFFPVPDAPEVVEEPTCGAQEYWYENGVQRARWCDKLAVMQVEAMDGSRNFGCAKHGAQMIDAGARKIRDLPDA